MSDFKSRLETEKSELDEKIKKLNAFISGNNFSNIDHKQQELLKQQLPAMRVYTQILGERLNLLN